MIKKMNKFFVLAVLSFSTIVSAGTVQLDPLTDPLTLTVNEINCKTNQNSDLSVCIFNKTGEDLSSNEINLGQAVQSVDGGYSSASKISYEKLENNHYLILESTFARIKEGDKRNQIPYAHVYYFLRMPLGKILEGCQFKWDPEIPPYNTPSTLIIEKINNELTCHFDKK